MKTIDEYKSLGYRVISIDSGHCIIYKFKGSGDRSLTGCLYCQVCNVDKKGNLASGQIFLTSLTDLQFNMLEDDEATEAYIIQCAALGKADD